MTDAALPHPALPRFDPILGATALALLASMALTLPALALDPRVLGGESVWLKPVKFQIALILYFGTLAWVAAYAPAGFGQRPAVRAWFGLAAVATLLEMAWIGGAAAFAVPSHYNPDGLMALIYPAMGVVAVQLTSVSLVLGLGMARDPAPVLPDPVHLSVWLGLVLTFALTIPAAFVLAGMPGHHVGVPQTGAAVPILGWSREVGDLRVGHFLATHALHGLPLVGLAAARLWPQGTGARVVWAAAALYAVGVLASIAQALAGQPLIPLR